jgi:hypothetical protein
MHTVSAEWQSASTAPSDEELEICALNYDGMVHALPFPCHRDGPNWVDRYGGMHADIHPTHWRKWTEPN